MAGVLAVISLALAVFVNAGWVALFALLGTIAWAVNNGPEWVMETGWREEGLIAGRIEHAPHDELRRAS